MLNNDDFFKSLLDNLYDGVYFVDRNRKITYWNKGAERLTGYLSAEVVGSHCSDNILVHLDCQGTCLCQDACPLKITMENGTTRETEVFLHHKEGHRMPALIRTAPIHGPQGEVIGAVEIFSNNSAKVDTLQKFEELRQMVFIDPLTGLANRRLLETSLHKSMEEMARYGWPFGVLMIDIDHFKQVNDRYGHAVGDEALRIVARTLAGISRPFDVIGRWGGEEFIAIIANVDQGNLYATANRYRLFVQESTVSSDSGAFQVTISVGATLATAEDSIETLLQRSDQLMYQSKTAGRNCVTTG